MSLKVCVLGSGSTGNCIFVSGGETNILIDLGLPATRVEKCLKTLGVSPDGLNVLVTHCHSDHICGVDSFCRRHPDTKLFCYGDCLGSVYLKLGESRKRLTAESGDFYIGDVTVSPFKVSHDVPCVGYSILGGGRKVTVATDIGVVPEKTLAALADSDMVILESNHDETLLKNNADYSPFLKKRILSDKGHLSNETCAKCAEYLASHGVKQIVLAHLSRENNYPELAFETCKNYLAGKGIAEGKDYKLDVAYPDRMSGLFEIG